MNIFRIKMVRFYDNRSRYFRGLETEESPNGDVKLYANGRFHPKGVEQFLSNEVFEKEYHFFINYFLKNKLSIFKCEVSKDLKYWDCKRSKYFPKSFSVVEIDL